MGLIEEMVALFVVGWVLGFVAGRGSGKAQALSLIMHVGALGSQVAARASHADIAALRAASPPSER